MNKTGKKLITIGKFILLMALSIIIAASLVTTGCADHDHSDHPHNDPPASSDTDAAKPASDFTVQDANGKQVKLSDFSGKPVVLNFWATWCPPCQRELPAFDKMNKVYGDKVQFLMINVDGSGADPLSIQESMTSAGFSFPLYFDLKGSAASAYRISSIPMSYFIDAEGNIVSDHLGSMSAKQLENEINKLLP